MPTPLRPTSATVDIPEGIEITAVIEEEGPVLTAEVTQDDGDQE